MQSIHNTIKLAILQNLDELIWERKDGRLSGIPHSELERVMSPELLSAFEHWMSNQTVGVLNGMALYYIEDVTRFLKNQKVVD